MTLIFKEIDKKNYKDDVNDYFFEYQRDTTHINKKFPIIERLMSLKDNYSTVSYDVFYELFKTIYQKISFVSRNKEKEYYSKVVSTYTSSIDLIEQSIFILNPETEDYEKQLKKQYILLEATNLRAQRELEKNGMFYYLYITSEVNAINIVRFNQSVISDMNFGNSKFFITENQVSNLIILLNLYPGLTTDEVVGDNESSRLTKLLSNKYGTFFSLNKYYYFVMYYFQKKISTTPINEYYRYKFFNFFRSFNTKLSVLITKNLDTELQSKISTLSSERFTECVFEGKLYNLSKNLSVSLFGIAEGTLLTESKNRYDRNLISFTKILIRKYYDAYSKSDSEQIESLNKEKIKKVGEYFKIFTALLFLPITYDVDINSIFFKFATYYNTLVTLIKPNDVSIVNSTVYNHFLKTYNDFDPIYRNTNNVVSNASTEPMYPQNQNINVNIENIENNVPKNTNNQSVSEVGPSGNVKKSGGGFNEEYVNRLRKELALEKPKSRRDRDNIRRFGLFFENIIIDYSQYYAHKFSFSKKKSFEEFDISSYNPYNIDEINFYDIIDRECSRSDPYFTDNLINLYHKDLDFLECGSLGSSSIGTSRSSSTSRKKKSFEFYVPKYHRLSDEKYISIIRDIDNVFDFDINNSKKYINSFLNISIFDLLIYRFHKHLLKHIYYNIQTLNTIIDIYNKTIQSEVNRIKSEIAIKSETKSKSKSKSKAKSQPEPILDPEIERLLLSHQIEKDVDLLNSISNPEKKVDPLYLIIINQNIFQYIMKVYTVFKSLDEINMSKAIEYMNTYNSHLIQMLKKYNIDNELSRNYNNNYNFSKLMNDMYNTQISSFHTNFKPVLQLEPTLNGKYYTMNSCIQYFDFLLENKEKIDTLKSINISKFSHKKHTISRLSKFADEQNILYNVQNTIDNILQIDDLSNINTSQSRNETILNLTLFQKIQSNVYNCLLYCYKNDILKMSFDLLKKSFIKKLILVSKYHLHDELIFNIMIPLLLDLFNRTCKNDVEQKYKIPNFEKLYSSFVKDIDFNKLDHNIFVEDESTKVENTYINLFLLIIYSSIIIEPYSKSKSYRKRLLYSYYRYDNYYKFLFSNKKLTKYKLDSDIEFISSTILSKKYYVQFSNTLETSVSSSTDKSSSTIESSTKLNVPSISPTKNEQYNEGESSVPKKVSKSKSSKVKILESVPVDEIIELVPEEQLVELVPGFVSKTTLDDEYVDIDIYQNLIEEKTYINENNRSYLSGYRMVNTKNFDKSNNIVVNNIDNIIKRVQVYTNLFLIERIKLHWDDIYTFLYITDIHYTVLKYSIYDNDRNIYKTCGAYTHITLKISNETMPRNTRKLCLFDGLLNQIPNFTEEMYDKVKFISFHYGLSTHKSEYYNLQPGAWISVAFTDNLKIKATTINLDYLYLNYNSFIDFIHNLYLLFIEFTKEYYLDYYIAPTCTKKENIVFIENDELQLFYNKRI